MNIYLEYGKKEIIANSTLDFIRTCKLQINGHNNTFQKQTIICDTAEQGTWVFLNIRKERGKLCDYILIFFKKIEGGIKLKEKVKRWQVGN